MNSRQFCSVCKQYLDMEIVQTADGDDDGVVWFRCPQCQGFLPKLSSAVEATAQADEVAAIPTGTRSRGGDPKGGGEPRLDEIDDALDLDALDAEVPGDAVPGGPGDLDDEIDDDDDSEDDSEDDSDKSPDPGGAAKAEPVHEYAAMLAAMDPGAALPYRPWETYEVGQCILHLAWNDCGVVVAKEALPGGRRVVKCWFQGAGVVRLIENAPR